MPAEDERQRRDPVDGAARRRAGHGLSLCPVANSHELHATIDRRQRRGHAEREDDADVARPEEPVADGLTR